MVLSSLVDRRWSIAAAWLPSGPSVVLPARRAAWLRAALLGGLLGGLVGACATPAESVRQPAPAGSFHTMQPGETIWDLSRQSGLSVEEIVEVNGLKSADEIAAGQVIFLPAGAAPVVDAPAPAERMEIEQTRVETGAAALRWPVEGVILRTYSTSKKLPYDGLLLAAPEGSVVRAAAVGEVVFVGDEGTDYGLLVILRHESELTTVYGHLGNVRVNRGQTVAAGDVLGVVGTTGGQESPRLHFQVRRGRTVVDPLTLLPAE